MAPHATFRRMAELERDHLSRECAILIEDAEAELRAIRAAFGAYGIGRPRTPALRIATAPLRTPSRQDTPPSLPVEVAAWAIAEKR